MATESAVNVSASIPKAVLGLLPSNRKIVPLLLVVKVGVAVAVWLFTIIDEVVQGAVVQLSTVNLLFVLPVRVRTALFRVTGELNRKTMYSLFSIGLLVALELPLVNTPSLKSGLPASAFESAQPLPPTPPAVVPQAKLRSIPVPPILLYDVAVVLKVIVVAHVGRHVKAIMVNKLALYVICSPG